MKRPIIFSDLFSDRETHRSIIKAGLVLLLVLEVFIYFAAVSHSGRKYHLSVYNREGGKIYETAGKIMTDYERRQFEDTFGPLSSYRIVMEQENRPFPFRAWLAVAFALPVGTVLLMIYLLRVWFTFLGGGKSRSPEPGAANQFQGGRFGQWLRWPGLSIYHIGLFAILCLLVFWLVPVYAAQAAGGIVNFIIRFKWFFLAVCLFCGALVVWVIYLRFRLSRHMMDRQMDLEKMRMEKELMLGMKAETGPLAKLDPGDGSGAMHAGANPVPGDGPGAGGQKGPEGGAAQ